MITPAGKRAEKPGDRGMIDRLVAFVQQQILLTDISDIAAFAIFGEQMVERLIAIGLCVVWDRLIPLFAVGKDRINVEDHATKTEPPMTHDITNGEAGMGNDRAVANLFHDTGGGVGGHLSHAVYVGMMVTARKKNGSAMT